MEILAMLIMLITRLLCSSQSSMMPMSFSLNAIAGLSGGMVFQAAYVNGRLRLYCRFQAALKGGLVGCVMAVGVEHHQFAAGIIAQPATRKAAFFVCFKNSVP